MTGNQASLLAVLALAIVHAYAGTTSALRRRWRPRALSAGAGISVAYIFLELLPDLVERQHFVGESGLLPDLGANADVSRIVAPSAGAARGPLGSHTISVEGVGTGTRPQGSRLGEPKVSLMDTVSAQNGTSEALAASRPSPYLPSTQPLPKWARQDSNLRPWDYESVSRLCVLSLSDAWSPATTRVLGTLV